MVTIPKIEGLETRAVHSEGELSRARRLHASCFLEAGFVDVDEVDPSGFIDDPWVPYSDYFVAIDTENQEIVGTCRIIRPSVRGFPVFQHFETDPVAGEVFHTLDPNLCVEVSSLATPRVGLQNMAISAELYKIVWLEAMRGGRAYMLAIMDSRLLRILRNWFHFPFEPLGPSREFMGDRTSPVSLYLPRAIEHAKAVDPDSVGFFCDGMSLSELDNVVLDLRSNVPEHVSSVIDLADARTAGG